MHKVMPIGREVRVASVRSLVAWVLVLEEEVERFVGVEAERTAAGPSGQCVRVMALKPSWIAWTARSRLGRWSVSCR
jgi:hypothetical protein